MGEGGWIKLEMASYVCEVSRYVSSTLGRPGAILCYVGHVITDHQRK